MALFTPTVLQSYSVPVKQGNVLQLDAGNIQSYVSASNTWFDLSGNGNNADVTNIKQYWNAGTNGAAYFDFPGNQNYATNIGTITNSTSLSCFNGDFTVETLWTCDAAATAPADNMGIIGKDSWNSNPGWGIFMYRVSSDPNFYGYYRFVGNGTELGPAKVEPTFVLNKFYYTVTTRRGSLVTTTANFNTIGTATNINNFNNSSNIIIGRGRNDATANYKMDGKIAYISIYNRALTAAERATNYNFYAKKYGMKPV
jgi:hypothetical protein